MKSDQFTPYLMIAMRNDLASMTPGRAAAQASHATSDFTHHMKFESNFDEKFQDWENSTSQKFGTTIVVGVNGFEMEDLYNQLFNYEYEFGKITDPSYAIKDGDVTHYINLDTCLWVFVDSNDSNMYPFLKELPLF